MAVESRTPDPNIWPKKRLDELGQVHGGSTPRRSVPTYWGGDIAWLTPGEMNGVNGRYVTATRSTLTEAGLAASSTSLLPVDSLLVTTRATLGSRALAGIPVATNQGFKSVVFGTEAHPDFYYHLFGLLGSELERRASGTTFLEISGSEFSAIEVPCPPLPEQRRIAQILDTVDEAIRKTEQVIEKLKLVKQGLLHDLLTRGLDEDGELRDPERRPEQFKDSPLGRIPRKWDVSAFGSQCLSSAFGPRFPAERYDSQGAVATLRTTDMDDEGAIDLDCMPRADLKETEVAGHLLELGDMVISRSGTCGVTGVFPGYHIPTLPGAFLIRFRLHDPLASPFFQKYFNSPIGRRRLDRLAAGGVQKNLKGSAILRFLVPIPTRSEMARIERAFSMHRNRIESEADSVGKLRLLKQGLMDDLLTGRVRVQVPDEAA